MPAVPFAGAPAMPPHRSEVAIPLNPGLHPDWQALVAAIRANPEDDAPRLVAADWIDGVDSPPEYTDAARAEFIRLRIKQARWKRGGRDIDNAVDDLIGLHKRFEELTGANMLRWWPWAFEGEIADPPIMSDIPSGFVEKCYASADMWLKHGDAIYAAEPVHIVRLTTRPNIRKDFTVQYNPPNFEYVIRRDVRWGDKTAAVALAISKRDALLGGDIHRQINDAQQELAAETSDERLLSDWWPGITFELPPDR